MNMPVVAGRALRAPLAQCSILVVDDVLANRSLISAGLRRAGFARVQTAADGRAGLAAVLDNPPDLLLLDLVMPELDGFEVCRALRADSAFDDLPILAITGLEDRDERAMAFAAGASDLIVKPIHQAELVARTTIHLERRLLVRGLKAFQERTSTELATAREMQRALLPGEATFRRIAERHGIAVGSVFAPSNEVGGDLWGMWSIDATRLGVYVTDVSGHGTIAAIDTFRLHTLLMQEDLDRGLPGPFMAAINDRLAGLLRPGRFATMFYAVVDTARNTLTYACGGCPDALLVPAGGTPVGLDGSGLPLGIVAGAQYPEGQVAFGKGARLLLHSDAFPESRLPDGTILGEKRALAMVAAALAHHQPQAVVAELETELARMTGDVLDDDLTLLCLAR